MIAHARKRYFLLVKRVFAFSLAPLLVVTMCVPQAFGAPAAEDGSMPSGGVAKFALSEIESVTDELVASAAAESDVVEVSTWKDLRTALNGGDSNWEGPNPGKSVRLVDDIQVDDEWYTPIVKEGDNLFVDLNGHQITIAKKDHGAVLFQVNKGGTLTVKDTQSEATRFSLESVAPVKTSETYEATVNNAGKEAVWDEASEKLTYYVTRSTPNALTGATEEKGEVYELAIPTGTKAIQDSASADSGEKPAGIADNDGNQTGSFFDVYGNLIIEQGTFSGCQAISGIVSIKSEDAKVSIENGAFTDNKRVFVMAGKNASLDIRGGLYQGNTSGVVVVGRGVSGTRIDISNGLFLSNSGSNGSVVDNSYGGAAITIKDSQFISNRSLDSKASGGGGAIYSREETNPAKYGNNLAAMLSISGNTVFAFNTSASAGGAIKLGKEGSLSIQDSVIFAKNEAVSGGAIDLGAGTKTLIKDDVLFVGNKARSGEKATTGVGGAIKALYENKTDGGEWLKLEGNVVFSGNAAEKYAGAVAVDVVEWRVSNEPHCIVSDNVAFSHNRVETAGSSVDGYGGGAMRINGYALINGGQFTSNYAAGQGGAIISQLQQTGSKVVMGQQDGRVPIVAANCADSWEGGGLCLDGGTQHKISAAYVTNNTCNTSVDYGGGGVFIGQYAHLTLTSPLVTKNTARGMGGGIAGCKTSEIITSAAAVFGNKAKQEASCATGGNPGQGDEQWLNMMNQMTKADKDKASGILSGGSSLGASSADCYLGHEGKVYSNMLGGGAANWRGFTLLAENDLMTNPAYNDGSQYKVGMREQNKRLNNEKYLKPVVGENGEIVKVGRASNAKDLGIAYEVMDFPEDNVKAITEVDKPTAMLSSTRMIGLQANPSKADEVAARELATVFISGNYSSTNGGGVANNGYLSVGNNPYEPVNPKPITGRLSLSKTISGDTSELSGSLTAVFKVNGYATEQDRQNQIAPLYSNVVAFTFDASHVDAQSIELENLPHGYYRVEEVSYSQDNFKNEDVRKNYYEFIVSPLNDHDKKTHIADFKVDFDNAYEDEGGNGSGVVNAFDDGKDGFSWKPISPETRTSREG